MTAFRLISILVFASLLSLSAGAVLGQPLRPSNSPVQSAGSNLVELRGEVIAFEFGSPVTRLVFDVQSSDGSSSAWTAETLSAVELRRLGWTTDSLTPGEFVLVRGQLLDGTTGRISLTEVERVNGSFLTTGTSQNLLSIRPGHYSLVPGRGYLRLSFDHQGFSTASFWFSRMQAGLDLDSNMQPLGLQVDLLTEDLQSGSAELTRLLKSSTFFAAANYPIISFTSERFTQVTDNRFNIEGTLTVKGVSQTVTLTAVVNKAGVHPLTGNPGFGISARGSLDRADWGLSQFAPEVGLDIQLEIEAEFELGLSSASTNDFGGF